MRLNRTKYYRIFHICIYLIFVFSIAAQDTTPPVIVTPGKSKQLACETPNLISEFVNWYNTAGGTVATDDSGQFIILGSPPFNVAINFFNASSDTLCGNNKNVKISFVAVDLSNNVSTPVVISFGTLDTLGPTLSVKPTNSSMECTSSSQDSLVSWIKKKGGAVAQDACSDAVIWTDFLYQPSTGQSGTGSITNGPYPQIPVGSCAWNVKISFIVKDDCGHEISTPIRTFEIKDSKAPVLSSTPPDVTVACHQVPSRPNITAQDACAGNPGVIFSETSTQSSDTLSCVHFNYTINRKWTARDGCGNQVEHNQKITVLDLNGPNLQGPSFKKLECSSLTNLDSLLTSKIDACSSIKLSYKDTLLNGNTCAYQIKRSYLATDVCNNMTTFVQTIQVADKSKPVIDRKATDQGIGCEDNTNINVAFANWLALRGGSKVTDGCSPNGVKSFAAVPGSYNINDTLTFPGIAPGNITLSSCPSMVAGLSRYEKVDFVYYDQCGNASVTSAHFGLSDNTPPQIQNCPPSITRSVGLTSCEAIIQLDVPNAIDNCSQFQSPLINLSATQITSPSPGNSEVIVSDILLRFGPYNANSFSLAGDAALMVDLINADADDTSEYFNIFNEDNELIGRTLNTPGQCKDKTTILQNLNEQKLSDWLADGYVLFTLKANVFEPPGLSINDVCPFGSRVKGTLTIPIVSGNLIQSYFTIKDTGDTTNITGLSSLTTTLPIGKHETSFIYTDCALNTSKCNVTINIEDKNPPTMICPGDLTVDLGGPGCTINSKIPLQFDIDDNCTFPESFSETMPPTTDAQKITFRFLDNIGRHVANNKAVSFVNAPKIKFADQEAAITVKITGDFNDTTEYFDLFGEGGYVMGSTQTKADTGCVQSETTFFVPAFLYNSWLADGAITITAVANNQATEEGGGINPCNSITATQTVDNTSTMSIRLAIKNPPINYRLDQGNISAVNTQEDSLQLSVNSGPHLISFSTIDKSGNPATCVTKLFVRDIEPPRANCKNFIARIHPSGLVDYHLSPDSINNNSIDNCAIDTMWVEGGVFNCTDVGSERQVILKIQDATGNISSCPAIIKVENTILHPTFTAGLCQGDTLKLYANLPEPKLQNTYSIEWFRNNELVATEENPIFNEAGNAFNGLYKLVVKGFNNCTAEGIVNINIQPLTTPEVTSLQDNYCDNIAVQLKTNNFSGNITYEWYEGFAPNGILLGNTNSPDFEVNPSVGIHNYYVIARSPECVSNASSTKRLIIHKKPVVVLLSAFENICQGGQIKLGTSTTGLNYQYKWNGPDGFKSELQNPPVIINAQNQHQGNYSLVISIGSCTSDTANTKVAILPKPGKPIINGETIYCEGNTFSLLVNNIPLQEKYTWYKDGVKFRVTQDNSLEIPNVPSSIAGKWTVVAESNGCTSDTSEVKSVGVDNHPVVGASNDGPYCEGDTIQLNSTTVPNASYKWKGPNDYSAEGQFVKAIAKTGEYFVTVKTTTGCESVASTVVEVNKAPVITALSNNAVPCMDGKTDILFSPSVAPPGSYEYKWSGPNNFNQQVANAKIIKATEADTGKYFLTVFNKNCPSKAVLSEVKLHIIPPKATFSIPSSICEGDTLKLFTTMSADTFYWQTPLGQFKTNTNSFEVKDVKKSNEGNYHCLISRNGCTSTDFDVHFLTVKDRPLQPAIAGDNDICYGDTVELAPNTPTFSQAFWTLPDGSKQTSDKIFVANTTTANAGSYTVAIASNGCVSPNSNPFLLTVRPEILRPTIAINDLNICSNDNIEVELCLSNFDPSLKQTYQWKFRGEVGILGTTSDDCLLLENADIGIGEFLAEVVAIKDGCYSLPSLPIKVKKSEAPLITAKANLDLSTICTKDQLIELVSEKSSPTVDVSWKAITSGVSILSPTDARTLVSQFQPGLNLILLQYSKDGCKDFTSDTVKIYLLDTPIANDDEVNGDFNNEVSFNVLQNDQYGVIYEIKFNEESENGKLEGDNGQYTFTPFQGFAGSSVFKYNLCVKGCTNLCDDATVTVKTGSNVPCVPPTIITPNGDGINDEFIIPCINTGNYPRNELIIFNQWGDEVFYANPYDNSWSGTYGNEALPVGTYYFVFDPGQSFNKLKGYLIIQR